MKKISKKQREQTVKQLLPKVKYYASRYAFGLPPELEIKDLVSAGIIGLIEAMKKYDPSKNTTLSTFADFRIRGAILDEIRSMQWAPKNSRKKLGEVRNTYAELEKGLNRPATDEEVAEKLNITLDELYKTLSIANTMNMINLDDIDLTKEGNPIDILGCISRGNEKEMLDELNLKELRAIIGSAIDELPEKERIVVTLYYFEELTMKEIGKVLDISESRVCQLHGKVLIKLRNKMEQCKS